MTVYLSVIAVKFLYFISHVFFLIFFLIFIIGYWMGYFCFPGVEAKLQMGEQKTF